MDSSYPSELLEGVRPLVFVVDAILSHTPAPNDPKPDPKYNWSGGTIDTKTNTHTVFQSFFREITKDAEDESGGAPGGSSGGDSASGRPAPPPPAIGNMSRRPASTANDGLLECLLAIDPQSAGAANTGPGAKCTAKQPRRGGGRNQKQSSASPPPADFFSRANLFPISHRHAFPPSKDPKGSKNPIARLNSSLQRAAAASASSASMSSHLHRSSHYRTTQLAVFDEVERAVGGILPAGWMEKHLHALPSVLLLVTVVDLSHHPHLQPHHHTAHASAPASASSPGGGAGGSAYRQAVLERHLSSTLEGLRGSCAKKRDCPVHLVLILLGGADSTTAGGVTGISVQQQTLESERIQAIKATCRLTSSSITTVHLTRVPTTEGAPVHYHFPPSELQKLQKHVRDASMGYYLTQVRRCKKKYSHLHHDRFTELLPVAARYCIKVAIFYEFQMEWDGERGKKSIKYWEEAYRNLMDYYRWLQTCWKDRRAHHYHHAYVAGRTKKPATHDRRAVSVVLAGGNPISANAAMADGNAGDYNATAANPQVHGTIPPPPTTVKPMTPGSGGGVEVALVYPPTDGALDAMRSPAPPLPQLSSPSLGGDNNGDNINPPPTTSKKKQITSPNSTKQREQEMAIRNRSMDMIHQCRRVADWLNVKLLLIAYASIENDFDHTYRYGTKSNNNNDGSKSPNSSSKPPSSIRGLATGNGGYSTVALQVRRHVKTFLSRQPSLTYGGTEGGRGEDDHHYHQTGGTTYDHTHTHDIGIDKIKTDPAWFFWRYVSRQRWILFQLTRRYPLPSAVVTRGWLEGDGDDLDYCTSSWHFAGAGESLLKLGYAVERERCRLGLRGNGDGGGDDSSRYVMKRLDSNENRQRFVGSLGGRELGAMFRDECAQDHFALALEALNHTVHLLTTETLPRQPQRQPKQRPAFQNTSASVARLQFLMGGILRDQGRYEDAIVNLRLASAASSQFPAIRHAIEMALVECWKCCPTSASVLSPNGGGVVTGNSGSVNVVASGTDEMDDEGRRRKRRDEVIQSSIRMMFNPRIYPLMRAEQMDGILKGCAAAFGSNYDDQHPKQQLLVRWPYGSASTQPLDYTFTFPLQTYATEGDEILTVLTLYSHLDVPIEVTNIRAITNVGTWTVPLQAQPEEEGGKSNISMTIPPHRTIRLWAMVSLPKDVYRKLDSNVLKQITVNAAKPKSSGLTRSGGGCYGSSSGVGGEIAADSARAGGELIYRNLESAASGMSTVAGSVGSSSTKIQPPSPSSSSTKPTRRRRRPMKSMQLGGLSVCCTSLQLTLNLPQSASSIVLSLPNHDRGSIPPPPPPTCNNLNNAGQPPQPAPLKNNWIDEEDNYTFVAWARPSRFSLSSGPRCIRVQTPQSDLEVTDLTSLQTEGRAMDGTVNRILFELRAGNHEECRDVRMEIRCESSVVYRGIAAGSGGSAQPLRKTMETNVVLGAADDATSPTSYSSRTPLLVECTSSSSSSPPSWPFPQTTATTAQAQQDDGDTDNSYQLPSGWQLCANGNGTSPRAGARDGTRLLKPVVDVLPRRGVAHTFFDIYRPIRNINYKDDDSTVDDYGNNNVDVDNIDDPEKDVLSCRTNFIVTFSYRQILPNLATNDTTHQSKQPQHSPNDEELGHFITKEYRGSVSWHPPFRFTTTILPGARRSFPSGSRHFSNTVSSSSTTTSGSTSSPTNKNTNTISSSIDLNAVVDGDDVNVRCSLEANSMSTVRGVGLGAEETEKTKKRSCLGGVMVQQISFQTQRNHDNSKCEIELVTGRKAPDLQPPSLSSSSTNKNDDDQQDPNHNILFSPKPNDICHMLRHRSKFGIIYTARPRIIAPTTTTPATNNTVRSTHTRLGAIHIHWIPISLPVPVDVNDDSSKHDDEQHDESRQFQKFHGPLPVPNLPPVRLDGPVCYVEATPFRASRCTIPSIPKVACPFEVRYRIRNRTEMHQKIKIAMDSGNVASTGAGGITGGGDDGSTLSSSSNSGSSNNGGVLVSGLIGGEMNLGPMESKELIYLMLFTTVGRSTMPSLHVSSTRYDTWIIHGDREESIFVTP